MYEILIVEDEYKIARFVSLELRHEGYGTTIIADGREALDAALEKDYDLIVLDVMLPSLNGIEILRRLRQTKDTPRTPRRPDFFRAARSLGKEIRRGRGGASLERTGCFPDPRNLPYR